MREVISAPAFRSSLIHRLAAVLTYLLIVLLFANMLFPILARAQSSATVQGTLTDPSGAAVSGAIVVAQDLSAHDPSKQTKQNGTRQTVSANDGHFELMVPPGRYRLAVTHAPFQRFEQEFELSPGENKELHVQLTIEPLSENVVVSAAAQPIATTAASEPVAIVTHEEIQQRQAFELAPLLQTLPGISLGQAGPAGGTVSLFLDGGNSNYAKVLIDGVPANLPGGAVDLSNFSLENVEKIEVVHGAQSALAGSDAMTGTIEVFTHRGDTHTPLLYLESEGGSFSTGRGMAQLSGLAGRFDYSAAAGYFETAGQGVNDRFLNRTLSGNFGLRLSDDDSLRLTVRSNTSDAGEPGQTLFTPPNLDQHNGLHNITAGLSWNFSTGTHWQHRVYATESDIHQLFQNLLSDFYTSPDPFGSCDFPRSAQAVPSMYCDYPYTSANQYNRANFGAQSTYSLRRVSLTAGYEYEVENAFIASLSGLHARRNNQAGYLDARWQPVKRLVLNAGFREEDNADFGTRGIPRAGAAFTLRTGNGFWDDTRLRFSYGQGIKEPSLDQSFGTDPCNPGNPNLRPEQSRTISAGLEQRLANDKVRVSADYFDNRFRDVTSFTFCFPGGPCPVNPPANCPFGFGSYFNTDLARSRGGHFVVETHITRRISLNGNYTYDPTRVLESPNAFDPSEVPGNRLLRRPVNSGNLVLNAGLGRFDGNISGVFVGRRTDSDFLFPPLGLTSNPGYVRVDLAMSVRLTARASLTGRIQNLFDAHYQDVLGFPALGIGGYVGVRFRIGGGG